MTCLHRLRPWTNNINRKDIQLAQVNLEQIIEEVLEQLKPEIKEEEAEVTVGRPLPKATGHHAILLQSVTNLVRNALKFVSSEVRPRVRIWAEEKDKYIRLWIKDNGICVSPENQELIFRLFEHLHGIETYSGIGVGLAIIHIGIMRMGGRFGVKSTPGKRSAFYIELPI